MGPAKKEKNKEKKRTRRIVRSESEREELLRASTEFDPISFCFLLLFFFRVQLLVVVDCCRIPGNGCRIKSSPSKCNNNRLSHRSTSFLAALDLFFCLPTLLGFLPSFTEFFSVLRGVFLLVLGLI